MKPETDLDAADADLHAEILSAEIAGTQDERGKTLCDCQACLRQNLPRRLRIARNTLRNAERFLAAAKSPRNLEIRRRILADATDLH